MTTIAELDLREALGEAPGVPCEHERCQAPGEAARWRWLPWCGCEVLYGDACKAATVWFLAQDEEIVAWCGKCREPYQGMCRDLGRVVAFG